MGLHNVLPICYCVEELGAKMIDEVEISSFDLRYESYRVRHPRTEKSLLASICEEGIREPLQGVDTVEMPDSPGVWILLNGFKRYRCAQ